MPLRKIHGSSLVIESQPRIAITFPMPCTAVGMDHDACACFCDGHEECHANVAWCHERRIFSIAFPFANSSISLSR